LLLAEREAATAIMNDAVQATNNPEACITLSSLLASCVSLEGQHNNPY